MLSPAEKNCPWRGKGVSTRRQSDPFEVTQTCSWRPELLHPTCADGPRPGPSPALSAQQTLPEHRRKVAWLLCSLRAPRELAGLHARWGRQRVRRPAVGAWSAGSALSPSEAPARSRRPVLGQCQALPCAPVGRGSPLFHCVFFSHRRSLKACSCVRGLAT